MAIIFGVKKFRQYLLGRKFIIASDHKPLMHLLGETRAEALMASARIQRWALTLGAYEYVIEYRPGRQVENADSHCLLSQQQYQIKKKQYCFSSDWNLHWSPLPRYESGLAEILFCPRSVDTFNMDAHSKGMRTCLLTFIGRRN